MKTPPVIFVAFFECEVCEHEWVQTTFAFAQGALVVTEDCPACWLIGNTSQTPAYAAVVVGGETKSLDDETR